MDFELDIEQKMLKDSIRDFVERACPRDLLREWDQKEKIPDEIYKKMVEIGLLASPIPKEYGGLDGSIIDDVIIIEELARGMSALSLLFMVTAFSGARSIIFNGTEEQKRGYLPRIAKGEIKFCFAITEPGGGTDILGALKTAAKADGEKYVINGQKIFTSGAHFSDYMLLVARTDENVLKKSLGLTLFIVSTKAPGVEITVLEKLGGRAFGTCEVFLTDVKVPKRDILGELNKGWYNLLATLNHERISTAAISLGIAQGAFEDSLKYAKERHAFGRPIGQFQAIQHYIADMAVKVELARLLTYKAAWLQSENKPCACEAAMAKLVATEAAVEVSNKGMDIFAGYGYMMDYDMQRWLRDARQYTLGPISNEMARNFIGESLGLPKSY